MECGTIRVAIVGCSYAGLSAAKEFVGSVDAFEQKREIESFSCGEVYTSGLYNVEPPLNGERYYAAKNFSFYIGGERVKIPIPKNMLWMTERDVIQKRMFRQCKETNFRFGESPKISELKEDYDYVVDATGHPSQSSREGLVDRIKEEAQSVFYRVEGDFSQFNDGSLHMWWLNPYAKGYVWLFNKTDNYANVGIGWDITEEKPPTFKDLEEKMWQLTGIDLGDCRVTMKGGGKLPLDYSDDFVKDNILITGEAGGLMNYCLGGGVHFAIASGREAVSAIARGDTSYYDKYVRDELVREVSTSKFLYDKLSWLGPEKFGKVSEKIAEHFGMDIFFSPKIKLLKLLRP